MNTDTIHKPASIWIRALIHLFELILPTYVILTCIFMNSVSIPVFREYFIIVVVLVLIFEQIIMPKFLGHSTIGCLFNVRIINSQTGNRPSIKQLLMRLLLSNLIVSIIVFPISFIIALFSKDNRTLEDRISYTIVVMDTRWSWSRNVRLLSAMILYVCCIVNIIVVNHDYDRIKPLELNWKFDKPKIVRTPEELLLIMNLPDTSLVQITSTIRGCSQIPISHTESKYTSSWNYVSPQKITEIVICDMPLYYSSRYPILRPDISIYRFMELATAYSRETKFSNTSDKHTVYGCGTEAIYRYIELYPNGDTIKILEKEWGVYDSIYTIKDTRKKSEPNNR